MLDQYLNLVSYVLLTVLSVIIIFFKNTKHSQLLLNITYRKIWQYVLHLWFYTLAFILFKYIGMYTIILGFFACLLSLLWQYFSQNDNISHPDVAKEHIGLLTTALIVNYIIFPYFYSNNALQIDSYYGLTLVFIVYSISVVYIFFYTPKFLQQHPEYVKNIIRSWYYFAMAMILAIYGVEVLLLVTFISIWIGVIFSYFKKNTSSVGSALARESVFFITFFWIFRSFVFQPFIVPTGSLEPTIVPGDFVLVNQHAYGLRFPVFGWKLYDVSTPKRGEIVVFRFPPKPDILYVKRVIGLPGDVISYYNDELIINGKKITKTYLRNDKTSDQLQEVERYREDLTEQAHDILTSTNDMTRYRHWDWVIPKDQYLMLGDNRQSSNDSRFWGLVPDDLLVGKVEYIIMSVDRQSPTLSFRSNRVMKYIYEQN